MRFRTDERLIKRHLLIDFNKDVWQAPALTVTEAELARDKEPFRAMRDIRGKH
jgi:hypothetical protein